MKKFLPIIFLASLLGCAGGGDDGGGNGGGSSPNIIFTGVTAITGNSAELIGTVYPNGSATNCWFDYGTDNSLTTFTSTDKQLVSTVDFTISVQVTSLINGLSGGTAYYY
jgi:hypothetical protein